MQNNIRNSLLNASNNATECNGGSSKQGDVK